MSAPGASSEKQGMLGAALAYAARGLAVFPLVPNTKRPITKNGFKDATPDSEQITAWWTETPDANIGVATGKVSGVTVLDVDIKPWEGKQGDVSLARLIDENGELPVTPKQRTWSGGYQYVFSYAPGVRNSAGELGKDLDVRGDGGYVVVPPSVVSEDGRSGDYAWDVYSGLDEIPLAPMPEWMVARLLKPKANGKSTKPPGWAEPFIDGVSRGTRDNTAWELIGRYALKGLSEGEVLTFMRAWAAKCRPPFDENKIREKVTRTFKMLDSKLLRKFPCTDAGNAERMVMLSGDRFRWVPGPKNTGEWLAWDGRRWAPGSTEVVMGIALDAARALSITVAKARQSEELTEKRKLELLRWAVRSESAPSILHAVKVATIPRLGVTVERKSLDANPDLLNVANGTLDLQTFALRPHDPADLMTQIIEVPYDPTAEAPRWLQFLREIFAGDQEVIDYLQRAVGYSLTGLTLEQVFFLLHGSGANGKSTLVDTLSALFGDYGVKVGQEALLMAERNKGRGATPELMVLKGRRFAYVNEMDEGRQLDEARIKAMTGSKEETGRGLYEAMSQWANTHKLWFDLNHLPTFKGVDDGIARRPRVIKFEQKFYAPEEQREPVQDKTLLAGLTAELPGILAWAVAGCRQWRARGLCAPESVKLATSEYVESQNHLPAFMADTFVRRNGCFVPAGEVAELYRSWCRANDEEEVNGKKLAGFLKNSYGLKPKRRDHGVTRVWFGIAVKSQEKEPAGGAEGNRGGTPGDGTYETPQGDSSHRGFTNRRHPASPQAQQEMVRRAQAKRLRDEAERARRGPRR